MGAAGDGDMGRLQAGVHERVSVVIPCYRSEHLIGEVVRLTLAELTRLGYDAEFVLVNDCSPDATFDAVVALVDDGLPVIGIDLAKNFGQHAAIMAGLAHASGDIVMLMDDDLQTHPSQCAALLDGLANERADVIFARYPKRQEALWRRMGSVFTRWSMRAMTRVPPDIEPSNYVVMRRRVADAMLAYTGPYPFVTGLILQSTAHVANVPVEHYPRSVGKSGYTMASLIRLWSTILNFSMLPLRVASVTGALMGAVGLVAALFLIIRRLLNPNIPVGWSSMMVTTLTCSGLIILFLGVVGEYVGRIFMTANHMPQYVIRRRAGHCAPRPEKRPS